MDANVMFSSSLTSTEVAEIEDGLRALGVTSSTSVLPPRRGPALDWLVIASLPLSGFLTMLGGKLAEEAYRELAKLVHSATGGRRSGAKGAAVVLEDQNSGTLLVLEHDLPDAGYRALLVTEVPVGSGATLRYDRAQGRWVAAQP